MCVCVYTHTHTYIYIWRVCVCGIVHTCIYLSQAAVLSSLVMLSDLKLGSMIVRGTGWDHRPSVAKRLHILSLLASFLFYCFQISFVHAPVWEYER